MKRDWYDGFFSGIVLDMWRKAIAPEQTRADTEFLERALSLRPGARVLDVPCGLGRHAVDLARRGYVVHGVDLSAEAIAEARGAAAAAGASATFVHSDMRSLPWEAEFDAAFSLGNSFGYLDAAGSGAFLKAVARALKPGGRFVLDSGMAAESILPRLREKEWAQFDDILFLEESRYDLERSVVETAYTFVRGAERDTRLSAHFIFTLREIRRMLADAGLQTLETLASVDGKPYFVGSPYLVVVAAKGA